MIPALEVEGEPVSASRIRALLKAGELEKVNQLLGEPYQLEGKVIHGHHRGKEMGFATANISWKKELLVPTGVYIARVAYNHRWYPAVVNIGYNPTFGDKELAIVLLDKYSWINQACDDCLEALVKEEDKNISAGDAVALSLYSRQLKRINSHLRNITTSVVNPFDRIGFNPKKRD